MIGRDNTLSDTLGTFSDVLAGKVQVKMSSLGNGVPGLTPGINGGASEVSGLTGGFGGPVFQPMMANGLAAASVSGQAAVAQTGQLAFAETSAAQTPALSSVEQSALERIEKNLAQGLFNDVNQAELQEISQILSELTPVQKNNVITNLSDDNLKTWGSEIDGWNGSLSASEQTDLFGSLARDLDSNQLVRVYRSFGENHQQGLMESINVNASSTTRQQVVDSLLTQAASDTNSNTQSETTQSLLAADALSKHTVALPQSGLLSASIESQVERGKQALEQLKSSPNADSKEIKNLEKQIEQLTEVSESIAEKIGENAIPLRAVLVTEENSTTVPLQLYAEKTGDNSWKIVDVTNPDNISTYNSEGDSSAEGLEAAWQDFINDNDLPKGQIAGSPPAGISEALNTDDPIWNQPSTGKSGFKAWSDNLGLGSMALAVAGIGSLFTGPGAVAAPYLFGAAFGTGVASAGLNTADRVDRDSFELLSACLLYTSPSPRD